MGGMGSGNWWRWNSKSTTSDFRQIDVRRWAREGYLEPGSSFLWRWTCDGEKTADIHVEVGGGRIDLRYKVRQAGGAWEDLRYTVRLVSQPCHFGGNRVWFECPVVGCRRRAAILYGGQVFACRHCHQLAYPSQRERGFERCFRKAEAIRDRLDWEPGAGACHGHKPKGMHWRTFNALLDDLDHWEDQSAIVLQRYLDSMKS